jgi:hypothetical protein
MNNNRIIKNLNLMENNLDQYIKNQGNNYDDKYSNTNYKEKNTFREISDIINDLNGQNDIFKKKNNIKYLNKENIVDINNDIKHEVLFIDSKNNVISKHNIINLLKEEEYLIKKQIKNDYKIKNFSKFTINKDGQKIILPILFKNLMNKDINEFYKYNLSIYKNSHFSNLSIKEKCMLTSSEIVQSNESEIKKRFYLLFYKYLVQYNIDYGTLLINLIEPDIFLLRWYLCLFSREFQMKNLLKIWDIILCYEWIENTKNKKKLNKHLNFIEFICLSMLKEIKKKIKENENDSNAVLLTIMHYPEDININNIILNSIKICKKITNENIFEYQ